MPFYADDPVFEGLGLCATTPCQGKAAIQREIERQVADKTTFTSVEPATGPVSGDVSSGGRDEIRSESIKAARVERTVVLVSAEVKGTKITSHRLAPNTADPQTATYINYVNYVRLSGILRQHFSAYQTCGGKRAGS